MSLTRILCTDCGNPMCYCSCPPKAEKPARAGFRGWLDSRLDRFVEMPTSDFERKCDAVARTGTTIVFTACLLVVLTSMIVHWVLR